MRFPRQAVLFFVVMGAVLNIGQRTSAQVRVLGWSSDGGLWAFMEEGDYGGGALADYRVEISVINSRTNQIHKRFKKRVSEDDHENPEPEMLEGFKKESLTEVRALGIAETSGVVVYQAEKSEQPVYSRIVQGGTKLAACTIGGDRFEVKLEDRYLSEEDGAPMSPDDPELMSWATSARSGFTLSIRKNEGPWKILQSDEKPARFFRAYRIHHISLAPSGKHLAVLVEAVESGFENHKTLHYLGAVGLLP